MPSDLTEQEVAEHWRQWCVEGPPPNETRFRKILSRLPTDPRCGYCGAPFKGVGSWIVRAWLGKEPSPHNPRYCNVCNRMAKKYGGGADVNLSMLFADVRGSTKLSEMLSAKEFGKLIDRYYSVATKVIVDTPGFIERLGGDEVIAYFGQGITGENFTQKAIQAGATILSKTGHDGPDGPWIPIGVGVHTGNAFFGSMTGPNGLYNITALGEEVNKSARIAAQASTGEMLVSFEAMRRAGFTVENFPSKQLDLKGISEPFSVSALGLKELRESGLIGR